MVDDHAEMVGLLADQLADVGYEVLRATDGRGALAVAGHTLPDVALTDLRLGAVDGLEVLTGLKAIDPDLPVLVMTAFGAIDTAVEAMRRGAAHYITKPFKLDELLLHVERCLDARAVRDENAALRSRVAQHDGLDGMIGSSPAMRAVYDRIGRLARGDVPVLIRGESGTGKERVARALHASSARSHRPFVALNCASLPATLLESELFGHVRGAFTGATGARRGLFVEADGGTLFLDEIGDMPIELQGHLLRVLEDGAVRAVGSDQPRSVDVRVVAATHQPLEQRIAEGRFRADLFYRLEVVPIALAPLRDRVEDIGPLVARFLAREAERGARLRRLTPEALAVLERYPWPGNVRELENVVRRLAILVSEEVAQASDVIAVAPSLGAAERDPRRFDALVSLRQLEDDYIAWVVGQCDGNKTRAAEILGIDPSTIHRRGRSGGR